MKLAHIDLNEYQNKKAALQKLKSMGLPTNKTEHYRYFGIKPVLDGDFRLYLPEQKRPKEGEIIEIIDGVITQAPRSVFVERLNDFRIDDSHYDQLYYLNHLLVPKVNKITISEDGEYKIIHRFTKDGVLLPYRIAIEVEKNCNISLKEGWEVSAQDSFLLYDYDFDIQKDAQVRFIQERIIKQKSVTIAPHSIKIHPNAALIHFTFDLGATKSLHNYHTTLDENSALESHHVIFAQNDGRMGNTFHIEHKGRDSRTKQFSRNILKDEARGIFDGLLIVKNGAKYSSIYQDSKTILLNDKAYMVSKPHMEIYTEYIAEATHGSTTGQLNEEALFYLRQRGIAKEAAKEMLVLSFLNEIFEKLGDSEIKEKFIRLYEEDA